MWIFTIRIRYLLIVSNIPIHFQKAIFNNILFEKNTETFYPVFFCPGFWCILDINFYEKNKNVR